MILNILVLVVVLAIAMSVLRTILGPTLLDRAAGADVAASSVACLLLVMSMAWPDSRKFVDVAWIMVALGLISSQVLAYFLAHRNWMGRMGDSGK